MDIQPLSPTSTSKPKSFWGRPEGKTGMLTLLGMGALGVWAVNVFGSAVESALALAIGIIGKTFVLGGLVAIAAVLYWLVTNKTIHALVQVYFKLIMRQLTSAVIVIDPIGIMRNYIESMTKKREEMAQNIRELNGQVKGLQDKIAEKKAEADQSLALARAANQQGNKYMMTVQSKQNDRLSKYTVKLEDVLAKAQFLLQMLRKYYDAAGAVVQDLSNEVNIQEDERKTITSAWKAMTAVRDILSGNGDQRENFDLAMEITKDQYGQKLGEIEDFMDTSKAFIQGIDLENGVFQEEALKKIAAWEGKVDSVILGDGKRIALETHVGAVTLPVFNAGSLDSGSDEYAKLFGSNSSR